MNESHQFEAYTLTSFDHVFPPGLYQFLALSFALENPRQGSHTLQSAVARVVNELPFLAGEVAPCPHSKNKRAMQIQVGLTTARDIPLTQVKEHPQFVLATTPAPGKRTGAGGHHARCADSLRAIVPDFDYSSVPAPVFRAQINVLADGIVLCLATNHMAIDGMGTDALIDLIATSCRAGEGSIPELRRCRAIQERTRRYLQHLETQKLPDGVQYGTCEPAPAAEDYFEPGELHAKHTLVFADAQVRALKGQCNACLAEISPAASSGQSTQGAIIRDRRLQVSSNDVLTALLWMSINQVRSHPGQQPREHSCVSVPVNTRTRFHPPLPDQYLSNAVVITESKLALSELRCLHDHSQSLEASPQIIQLLSLLAYRIRSSIATVDDDYLRRSLSQAHHTSNWGTLLAPPGDVIVTSLRSWNSFSLNFGPTLGSIIALEPVPIFAIEGECMIKPRRWDANEDDLWEVMITLKPEHMQALRDSHLMRWTLKDDYPGEVYQTR